MYTRKVYGVSNMQLALFPLNTVLFPGMPLKLHIFEERYKLMMNECIEDDKPFGVVLIESGVEAMGPLATPHLIGCTARISHVKRLAFGRMNIIAVGQERFRILSLSQERPFLSGSVEMLPLQDENPRHSLKNGMRLLPLVKKYLNTLETIGQLQFDYAQLPKDPQSLAFLSAVLLQTENEHKQELLDIDSVSILIDTLITTYRREVVLLDTMLNPPETTEDANPFSAN